MLSARVLLMGLEAHAICVTADVKCLQHWLEGREYIE